MVTASVPSKADGSTSITIVPLSSWISASLRTKTFSPFLNAPISCEWFAVNHSSRTWGLFSGRETKQPDAATQAPSSSLASRNPLGVLGLFSGLLSLLLIYNISSLASPSSIFRVFSGRRVIRVGLSTPGVTSRPPSRTSGANCSGS